jgi:hypothetical protein
MSKTTRSSDAGADDETEEFDPEEYDGDDWVVTPEELKGGDFHTLDDADDRLSE